MTSYRWVVLAILFLGRFSLGFQFQSVGSVAPFLVGDLGIDYTQIGTLVGLFMLPGLVLSIPCGFLGRRYGDKRVVVAGLALLVLGGLLPTMSDSYDAIALARIVSGTGAAALFVLMTKMVFDWFSGSEVFVGMSINIIGWPIGIAAGQASQGYLAELHGWVFVFLLTAVLAAAALSVLAVFYRSPPGIEAGPRVAGSRLSRREIWLVSIAGLIWMLVNGGYLVVLSFGPTLLLERGVPLAEAGAVASAMSWVFIIALPVGGIIAARFDKPNVVMMGGLALATLAAALLPLGTMPVVTFMLVGVGIALSAPVMASLPAELLRPENKGPGIGVYYIWYYAGSAFLPAVGGAFKDWSGTAALSMWFAASMLAGCLALIGLLRWEQARKIGPMPTAD